MSETNDSFISSISGENPSPESSGDTQQAGDAGFSTEQQGKDGQSQIESSSAPPPAPSKSASGPADNANRDHVANLNAALREERAARKQLEQRLAALEKPQAPPPQEEPEPDFLEDPKAVVDKLAKRIEETEKARKEREEKEKTEREQQERAQENWNRVLEAESTFAATVPDYTDAIQHVRKVSAAQVKLANPQARTNLQREFPDATDEQINQELDRRIAVHIQQQEMQSAMHILSQGGNPSEAYYKYAQELGYKPKQAAAPQIPKVDRDAVRSMGSGGGSEVGPQEEDRKSSGLSELRAAHEELKAERKKSPRSR